MSADSSFFRLGIERVDCAEPFHAYHIGRMSYPLREPARGTVSRFFSVLRALLREDHGLQETLWLDMKQLHRDGGSRVFSTNARRWSPSPGFCFDPTLSPPRSLELGDLMDVEYGTAPRIDDRSAMRVTRAAATDEARQMMTGRATNVLLYFATEQDPEQEALSYERYTRQALRTCMTPGHFQSFDFYLPLLHSGGVRDASAVLLDRWLERAVVYAREAEESSEVVVVSRLDLREMLGRSEFGDLVRHTRDREWNDAAGRSSQDG